MRIKTLVVALLLVPLSLGSWAFWLEPASLRNEDITLSLPLWPTECAGIRVAVLADIHVGSPWNGIDKLREIVALTLAAQPDLILLAGDYVIHGVLGGSPVAPEVAAAELAALSAPAGVFSVLGNHDWWLDAPRVQAALHDVGIRSLEDAAVRLEHDGCAFWLAGVSDYWEGAHDIDAALASVPDAVPTLVFTHNPDLFPEIPPRVALTIAGHTHGGQVYVPGIGRPVVPSKFGQRYAIGHVEEAGRHLFVSPGLGTSILPVRFLVPPEISVLTLEPSEAEGVVRPKGESSSSRKSS